MYLANKWMRKKVPSFCNSALVKFLNAKCNLFLNILKFLSAFDKSLKCLFSCFQYFQFWVNCVLFVPKVFILRQQHTHSIYLCVEGKIKVEFKIKYIQQSKKVEVYNSILFNDLKFPVFIIKMCGCLKRNSFYVIIGYYKHSQDSLILAHLIQGYITLEKIYLFVCFLSIYVECGIARNYSMSCRDLVLKQVRHFKKIETIQVLKIRIELFQSMKIF